MSKIAYPSDDTQAAIAALNTLPSGIPRAILLGQLEGQQLDAVLEEAFPCENEADKRELLRNVIALRKLLWKKLQTVAPKKDVRLGDECGDPLQGALLIPFGLHLLSLDDHEQMTNHLLRCHACHDELWMASVPLARLRAHWQAQTDSSHLDPPLSKNELK